MTRAAWNAEKQANEAAAIAFHIANKSIEAAKVKMEQADKKHQHLAGQATAIQAVRIEYQRELASQFADVARLKLMNEKKEKELASLLKDASVVQLRFENTLLRKYLNAFCRLLISKKSRFVHHQLKKNPLVRG